MASKEQRGSSGITNITKIQPNIKERRRRGGIEKRLCQRPGLQFKMRPKRAAVAALGYFDFLPLEIQKNILDLLPADALATFACCCKSSNQQVIQILQDRNIIIKFMESCLDTNLASGVNPEKCWELGHLLLSVMSPHPFHEAVKIAKKYCRALRKGICVGTMCANQALQSIECCKYETAFGYILKIIMSRNNFEAKWIKEIVLAVETEATSVGYNLRIAWEYELNVTNQPDQVAIRNFYHRLLLGPHDSWEDRSQVLKVLLDIRGSMKHKATMILVLYGPIVNGVAAWNNMPGMFMQMPENVVNRLLQDLGGCLVALLNCTSEIFFVNLIQELTKLPSQWLSANVATLLIVCGEKCIQVYMRNQAKEAVADFNKSGVSIKEVLSYSALDSLACLSIRLVTANFLFMQFRSVRMQNILMSVVEILAQAKMHNHFMKAMWDLALQEMRDDAIYAIRTNTMRQASTWELWKVVKFQQSFAHRFMKKFVP